MPAGTAKIKIDYTAVAGQLLPSGWGGCSIGERKGNEAFALIDLTAVAFAARWRHTLLPRPVLGTYATGGAVGRRWCGAHKRAARIPVPALGQHPGQAARPAPAGGWPDIAVLPSARGSGPGQRAGPSTRPQVPGYDLIKARLRS